MSTAHNELSDKVYKLSVVDVKHNVEVTAPIEQSFTVPEWCRAEAPLKDLQPIEDEWQPAGRLITLRSLF